MGIKSFFSRRKSREIAKDRLKILLISDRVNCSPEMKIDAESMEIQIAKTDSKGRDKTPILYANIPILDLHKNVN